MGYAVLADLLEVVHLGYLLFVVLGQVAILVGLARGWRWVRNPWFRWAHLLAIGIVAAEAILNITCPLTSWELQLRRLAGQPVEEVSFVGRLVDRVLFSGGHFNEAFLNAVHIGFGVLVLVTFVLAPPRRRRPAPPPAASAAGSRSPAPGGTSA
jgi:hypothetical protein